MNKIRVKDTGEILNVAEDSYICGLRRGQEVEFTSEEVEFIADSDVPSDWSAFRREAAKDLLCAALSNSAIRIDADIFQHQLQSCITMADALIDKLREDKE